MMWAPWETAESVVDKAEPVEIHLRGCGLAWHRRPMCGERGGQSVYFYEWADIPNLGDIYTVCGECLVLVQAARRNVAGA